MRVLCLHGLRQNKDILKKSFEKIIKKSLPEKITYDFIDSPFNFSTETDLKAWWQATKENALTIDKYDTINESIAHISNTWNNGTYDGFLGFSQGSVVVQILLYLQQNNKINLTNKPKFGILCSTSKISDTELLKLYENKLETPILIFHGEKDNLATKENAKILAQYFSDCEYYEHQGGHYVCDKNTSINKLIEFIKRKN